ncbi:hypothetical protein H696_02044 [Fonticula alba]|uniref:CP-type G domain-containing protein n=1 Tax=Fonticula alba TaxID=691883 RepID=A0A058ZCD5_FONAL|nr:hypothetical protein H696_02044 [Fonticula alba]KCV71097.1 hypothetical protein H696_02044 [Fonticula alba]|eukprot:XP_009494220.1 hypothetical protein H696_02044 [Fonticula alba]
MVPKKHGSNRMSAYLKYKIARNVRDHNRKAKKAARANPNTHRLKKDPGIPSLWPFKDRLVQQVLEAKEQARIDREAKREAYRAKQIQASQLKREEALLEEEARTVEDLQQRAERRAAQSEREQRRKSTDAQRSMQGEAGLQVNDNSRRAYYREFRKVVEAADVILQVLDARDPLGCRSPQIEEMILKAGGGDKKIILVLNKVDLVPRKNVEAWIKYLSHEFPTIAFKASTQQQRTNIGHGSSGALNAAASSGGSDDSAAITTSECLGADSLIRLLKNYSRSHDIKTSLRVGVVGFPNVGKSSLINSLRRSRVCGVGAVAGFTKTAQEVILDKNIRLLDCPGILFTGDDATVDPSIVLRNCVRVEAIADPVGAVGYLLTRLPKKQVMLLYRVGDFDSTIRFLGGPLRTGTRLVRCGVYIWAWC